MADGLGPQSTKVLDADGNEIHGISRIDFEPIDASVPKLVRARLTMIAKLDLRARVAAEDDDGDRSG